jgi:putative ABC transport system ATP-binding protein
LFDETVEAALRRPFSLKVHRGKEFDRARAVRFLADLGRGEDFLEKRVADLSGGEAQIAALIRAIQLEPSVLLLDEPTAALDSGATEAVEKMILCWLDEARADRALVWISHNADQAQRVGEKIVMMEGGRIV